MSRTLVSRTLLLVTALGLVVASGLVQGQWSHRWSNSQGPELDAAVAKLKRLPMSLGDWDGQARSLEHEEEQVAEAKISGWIYRTYRNRLSGREVSLFLVCGPPGPIAMHTPELCFPGAGLEQETESTHYAVSSNSSAPPAEFWWTDFRMSQPAGAAGQRVFWAWNASGAWAAPKYPRLAFARSPFLYKLYVSRPMFTASEPLEGDPCTECLRQVLPALDQCLFAPASPSPERGGG